jgi:hypothetical protein
MAIPSSIYPSLRLEGGLFSPDLIEALTTADLPGQKPPDFRLPPGRSLTGEIAAAFNDARALWQVFQNRLERLPADDPATSATREFWVIPFLRLLGYDLRFNSRALEVDGAPFPISHALGADQSQDHAGAEASVPVHIVGCRQELGRVAPAARPRLSPHALVQEYLNRSEALWGLVTNGRTLRLLRNSTFVRRQAYVEFDLAAIFADEGRFADFVLLYRLLHRTRLPSDGRAPADCLLETYYQQAVEQGGRVRERLRDGVEQAIVILANGFLRHPASVALRATLQPQRGEESASSAHPSEAVHAEHRQRQGEGADALYRQLLRLVYRLLFLLTAEERGLMGGDPLYRDHYGVGRLRRLCTRRTAYTDHDDLWLSLRALWLVLTDERMARLLDAPPLNGELFAHQELDDASIANRDLLRAFWHLAFYREGNAPPRRVNYAALDTEELGSVYESLLDYHPAITFDTRGRPTFVLTFGSERKATGSYYTPPSLVNELVQSALAPVLEERVRPCRTAQEKEAALLALNVLDPACGSGHFLLAAARRLGKELARIRTGEDEPAPERVREAIRDVVAHCIYGVDRNPLAVELARVALWLESHAEGKPLTFLDHRIKCGDSLVGVLDLEALREGLPDDAFAPVVGDDRKLAANLKRRNRTEREGQLTLFDAPIDHDLSPLAETVRRIETIRDDTPDQVHRKRATYEAWRTDPHLRRLSNACDLWTAAFFQALAPHPRPTAPDAPLSPAQNPERIITTDVIRRVLAGQPIAANLLGEAQALAAEHRFFHWPLDFPEVFASHPRPLPPSPLKGRVFQQVVVWCQGFLKVRHASATIRLPHPIVSRRTHAAPTRIIAMARLRVNPSPAPERPTTYGAGTLEFWNRARPQLWTRQWCDARRHAAPPKRPNRARTAARAAPTGRAQTRRIAGRQASRPRCDRLFCALAPLGDSAPADRLPHVGRGDGCLDPRAGLHHLEHQCGHPRQRYSHRLDDRRRDGQRRPATALGTALRRAARCHPRRLDGHRARRSGHGCPLVVSHDHGHGAASVPAHQSTGAVVSRRCSDVSAPAAGHHQRCGAMAGPGDLFQDPRTPTGRRPAGTLGCGVCRTLVDSDRPAAQPGRCDLVWSAGLDRGRLQRCHTRRLALGADQNDRSRAGHPAVVGDRRRHAVGRPCRRLCRSRWPSQYDRGAPCCTRASVPTHPSPPAELLSAWGDRHRHDLDHDGDASRCAVHP